MHATLLPERFWKKVVKTDTCWLWTAAKTKCTGYGAFTIDGKTRLAHLLTWVAANGPVPGGRHLSRLCENANCVNPAHWSAPTREERFWSFVDRNDSDPSSCWRWIGNRLGDNGYGRFKSEKLLLAHRVSYEIANGPIPHGMKVLHRCDNPACVRPEHLFLGTLRDNTNDMVSKGRAGWQRGQRQGTAKLTEPDVLAIRRSRAGTLALALRYGVSVQNIRLIRSRQTWKDL